MTIRNALSAQIGEFAASVRLADLPAPVVEQAHYILLDTMGAILAGAAEPEHQQLGERLLAAAHGRATAVGFAAATSAATAALLNGTAGTFLEVDEGNRYARGHPAIHVLPAAWAMAETQGATGTALLEALIVGYEVACRVGAAARLRPSMHPHGTWGGIGAAVAAARLCGFSAGQIAETANVASSLTLATSKKTMLEGGLVRNVYAGVSNHMGVLATDLVASGFNGERNGIESVFGTVVSDGFDAEAMTRGLGADWQIMHNYFKRHACCRYNHGALDALDILLREHGPIDPSGIDRIDVVSYRDAAELSDQTPENTLAGKFSVPFALATRIVTGGSDVHSFTWDALRNPRARELAKRVFVVEDPEMTAQLPEHRPARVCIVANGKKLEASVATNRGDNVSPYSRGELEQKFDTLAQRGLGTADARRLRATLLGLTQTASLGDVRPLLYRP